MAQFNYQVVIQLIGAGPDDPLSLLFNSLTNALTSLTVRLFG
jgi:hypothetical protein